MGCYYDAEPPNEDLTVTHLHDQTKGRIFRAAVRKQEARHRLEDMRRISGKRAWKTTDNGVLTLFWDFFTPKQLAELRGLTVSLDDPDIDDTVDFIESVQAVS